MSLWTHFVPDQQVKAVVFFDIEGVVNDRMVVWTLSSAEVVDDPVCQEYLVVDGDHVVTSGFVAPGYKLALFNPSQTAWVLVGEFQEFLDAPERRHLPVDP